MARVKINTNSLVTGVEAVRQKASGVRFRVTYQKIQASDKHSTQPGEAQEPADKITSSDEAGGKSEDFDLFYCSVFYWILKDFRV